MTRGLMGNWTFDIDDDFTLPSGREQAVFQTDDIKGLHNEFGMKCKFSNIKILNRCKKVEGGGGA